MWAWLLDRGTFVAQVSDRDCGVACLAMALRRLGLVVDRWQLEQDLQLCRDGAGPSDLQAAAAKYGVSATTVPLGRARELGRHRGAAVVLVEAGHFVLLDAVGDDEVVVLDPARGRLRLAEAVADERFGGVALVLERGGRSFAAQRPPSALAGLVRQLSSGDRAEMTSLVGLSALLQALALTTPFLVGQLIEELVIGGAAVVSGGLLGAIAAIAACRVALGLSRVVLMNALRLRISLRLAPEVMGRLLRLPLSFFHARSTGDLVQRVKSHLLLREVLGGTQTVAVFDFVLVVVGTLMMALVSPPLAALLVVLLVARAVFTLVLAGRQMELFDTELWARGRTSSVEVGALAGILEVKGGRLEQAVTERWQAAYWRELDCSERRNRLDVVLQGASDVIGQLAPLAVLGVGWLLLRDGSIGIGTLVAFAGLSSSVLGPAAGLVRLAGQAQSLLPAAERLEDIRRRDPEPCAALRRDVDDVMIALRDVSFRYPGADYLFTGLSFAARRGRFVALRGRSGTGKSSLARLLAGVLRPEVGHLECARDLEPESDVLLLTENPLFLAGTVAENLGLGNAGIDQTRLELAARRAEIHTTIAGLRHGYQANLAELAANLSSGQRQRLGIARALARNPKVLILDEATNGIDLATEARILAAIRELGITLVAVTHRQEPLALFDEVWTLECGRLLRQRSDSPALVVTEGVA